MYYIGKENNATFMNKHPCNHLVYLYIESLSKDFSEYFVSHS